MDSKILFQLNEAYRQGVYEEPQDDLEGIQEWVESLIAEGYNLDDYTDEELYDAYMSENVDTRRAPKELLARLTSSREGWMADDGPNKPATEARQRTLRKAQEKREQMKEEIDLYDVISDYLVTEGFCDTPEDAAVIMANMSEEWRSEIVNVLTEK